MYLHPIGYMASQYIEPQWIFWQCLKTSQDCENSQACYVITFVPKFVNQFANFIFYMQKISARPLLNIVKC